MRCFARASVFVSLCVTVGCVTPPAHAVAKPRWRLAVEAETQDPSVFGLVVAPTRDSAWAFGTTVVPPDMHPEPLAYGWNGRRWKRTPLPASFKIGRINSADGSSRSDVWATGDGNLLHWNGRKWRMALKRPEFTSQKVVALGRKNVWVSGFVGEDDSRPAAMHYNGKRWKRMRFPARPIRIESFGKNLWVLADAGRFGLALHRFDGRRWTKSQVPGSFCNPANTVHLLARKQPIVFCSSALRQDGFINKLYTWNGSRWKVRTPAALQGPRLALAANGANGDPWVPAGYDWPGGSAEKLLLFHRDKAGKWRKSLSDFPPHFSEYSLEDGWFTPVPGTRKFFVAGSVQRPQPDGYNAAVAVMKR